MAKPVLAEVTLVAVTSVAIDATVQALRASMQQCHFGKALLLTDRRPAAGAGDGITVRQISQLRSRVDYSRFMLRELAAHVSTSHALCVQWDGFVLDGGAWDPQFLDFDYIGAVWPHFDDAHNVGNGGFSLRSLRLLQACRELPFDGSAAEDVVIGRLCRPQLEQRGMRFAPDAIARKFAYERTPPTGHEFGFHGVYNFVRRLKSQDADRLLGSIEPNMLTRAERRELLGWAICNGRFRLAFHLLVRLLGLA